jgi:hypothetical protein
MKGARLARHQLSTGSANCPTNRPRKNISRSRKPGPKPVPETRTETSTFPVLETRTTGSGRKPGLPLYLG